MQGNSRSDIKSIIRNGQVVQEALEHNKTLKYLQLQVSWQERDLDRFELFPILCDALGKNSSLTSLSLQVSFLVIFGAPGSFSSCIEEKQYVLD